MPARPAVVARRLRQLTRRDVLVIGLVAILATLCVRALFGHLLDGYAILGDLEIPRRAAARWLDGDRPYLPEAFGAPPGVTQPFVYPPFVLPFVAVIGLVPPPIAGVAWFILLLGCALFALERLAVPRWWWPLVLIWPPFAEPLVGGNVQVALFAAFVGTLYVRDADGSRDRPFPVPAPVRARIGVLAASVGAIKVSQPHTWLYLARRDPRAALAGAAIVVGVVLVTLPLTGLSIWSDWVAQLDRARGTGWPFGGYALNRFVPLVGLVVSAACVVLLFRVPARAAGAWVGLLAVVGAYSLYIFGMLFLLPALLLLRRELALVAAILIATYTYEGSWTAIGIVAVAMVASRRATLLLEQNVVARTWWEVRARRR